MLAALGSAGGLLLSAGLPVSAVTQDLPQAVFQEAARTGVQTGVRTGVQTGVRTGVQAGSPQTGRPVALARSNSQPNRLVLSLRSRRVYLYQGEMLLSSYPVAVGTHETPTPQGEFAVSKMVVNPVWQSPWTGEVHAPGPNSALGLRWIEFASTEAGAFGFHGTPTVESIGQAASNGCVRMYNEDVVALFAQVSVGTPVLVVP
ncbi:MAG: L,D-transpeptidase [Cyanobacteria bacterium J06627_32]